MVQSAEDELRRSEDVSDTVVVGRARARGGAELSATNLEEPLLVPTESPQNNNNNDNNDDPLPQNQDDSKNIIISCGRSNKPIISLNHNVFLTLVLDVIYGVSDGLWGGTVFAAYLKRIAHGHNGPVGNIEAVNGLSVLFSALPVGYLADKIGRDKVIKAGGLLIALTAALHLFILDYIGVDQTKLHHDTNAMILLGIVMALWGIGSGIVSGPCQALYADSTPVGSRTKYYQYLFVCYMLASCLGPLVSIILFQTLGDQWNLNDLRTVVYVGLGLEFLNAFIMMFFDDKKALDENEDDSTQTETESAQETNSTPHPPQHCGENTNEQQQQQHQALLAERTQQRSRKWIPYIMFTTSLVFSIGSGMTVKFFPLFFKDQVGMTPTEVQIIYVLVPIVMACMSQVATGIAASFGRVQTTILLDCLGVLCLFSMVLFKGYLDTHPFVLVPIYIIRTGLMNCSYPLQESILMDFVPKNERARWKSLESVSAFGWCGSAALGGYVSDRWDYSRTFLVTAFIQTFGIAILALLLPLVPRREQDLLTRDATTTTTGSDEAVSSVPVQAGGRDSPIIANV